MVEFFYEDTIELKLDSSVYEKWLSLVCENEESELGDVNIIFCSDDYLLDVNVKHLNHDYYTDIITFDYYTSPISGDLFISVDRVLENAESNCILFDVELNRVIVHGVLHLLGYGDKEELEIKTIRAKEDLYISLY